MMGENLLPAHRVEARRVARVARVWAMALGTGLIGVAFASLGTLMATSAPRAMPVGIMGQLDEAKAQLDAARLELAAKERSHGATQRSQAVPDWAALLGVLAHAATGRATYHAVRVEPASDGLWTISLVGHATDGQHVLELRSALESTGLLTNVRSGTTPNATGPVGVGFHLDAQVAPGATR